MRKSVSAVRPSTGRFLPRLRAAVSLALTTALLAGLLPPAPARAEVPPPAAVDTVTTVTAAPNPSIAGQDVQVSWTIVTVDNSLTPGGGMNISIDGSMVNFALPANNGTMSRTLSGLAAGVHTFQVDYLGDFATNPSSNTATFVVNATGAPTATTLSSSVNPLTFGDSTSLTANVAYTGGGTPIDPPSGIVTFSSDGTPLATVPVSPTGVGTGSATLLAAQVPAGSHQLTASYSGDSFYSPSASAPVTEQVNRRPASLSLSAPSTALVGSTPTVTANVGNTVGATPATGTVSFFANGSPIGTGTVTGNSASVATPPLAAGTPIITASYTGDANYLTADAAPSTITVSAIATSTTVSSSANPAGIGASVTLTASISGTGPAPTGTVTFLDNGAPIGTGPVSGGAAVLSTAFAAAGTHPITASYAGDANNSPSVSTVMNQTVNKTSATVALSSAPNPAVVGSGVTFTATVTGTNPTGTVTFTVDGTAQAPAALSGGIATLTVPFATAGFHSATATYNGDANNLAATSNLAGETVTKASSTATLVSSSNPSIAGSNVTFTAQVSGPVGSPTGSVDFIADGSSIGSGTLSGGVATLSTSLLSAGPHVVTTSYPGDALYNGSTSAPLTQTVDKASPTLSVASGGSPSTYGDIVTFTATLGGGVSPTGTVTFTVDGAPQIPASLSGGTASISLSNLAVGSHQVAATYSGDANNAAATAAAATQSVVKANSTASVTSSINPALPGQAPVFTATVTGITTVPTGTVTFTVGGSTSSPRTLDGSGQVSYSAGALAVGDTTVTVSYLGDANYNGATSAPLTQTVNQGDVTLALASSVNPTLPGQSTTLTATVAAVAPAFGTPSGSVTFNVQGQNQTVNLVGGKASASFALPAGVYTATASYSGSTAFKAATGTATQTVNQAGTTTTVVSSLNPATQGSALTFTASVTGAPGAGLAPGGVVTFKDNGNPIGTGILSGGSATFATSSLAGGNHSITATYGGDGNFTASDSATFVETINNTVSSVSLTASPNPSVFGQNVVLTATVAGSGNPTGTVTFKDGATVLGTRNMTSGVAVFTAWKLATGPHSFVASYSGDGVFNAADSAAVGQIVNKAQTTANVSVSPATSSFGQSVTFTATVAATAPGSGTPTGTVTFLEGATVLGTGTLSGGSASFATSSLSTGSHPVTASYAGDANFEAAVSQASTATVGVAPSDLTLTSSLNPASYGQAVTFTATVTGGSAVPTGAVTFSDGTTTLGTGTLSGGVATFTTSALASGTHPIGATYGGDVNYAPSAQKQITQVISPAATTLTVASSANPGTVGQPITFTVSATSSSGQTPTGTVTVTLDGAGGTTKTVTLSGGSASFAISSLGLGNHAVTASYAPDSRSFGRATAQLAGGETIIQGLVAVGVDSSKNPSSLSEAVTFTATVAKTVGDGTPSGTVTFKDGAATIGTGTLSGTTATFSSSSLAVGSHQITATYGGDGSFAAAASAALAQTVTVDATTTTVVSSANPSAYGVPATLTATVAHALGSAAPTGKVTFSEGATTFGAVTPDASGNATLVLPATLSPGAHSITAAFAGDANYGASSGTATQTVNQNTSASVALASSLNPSKFGDAVTFTATMTVPAGTSATGTVTFKDGATVLGTGTLSANAATFASSSLAVGDHQIVATYEGDGNFAAATSAAVTQTVKQATTSLATTSSLNPSMANQNVTFTATLTATGSPTGTVTFTDGATTLGTVALSNKTASLTIQTLSVGSHQIVATYSGDASFTAATAPALAQTVNQAATNVTLASSLNPSTAGQAVKFTATVAVPTGGNPTGTVVFKDGAANIGTGTITGGTATFTTSSLNAGSHQITATYGGDVNYAGATSAALTQAVDKAATSTAVASSKNPQEAGKPVTFTATVTSSGGTPNGTVTFTSDGTSIGSATLSSGRASVTVASLAIGKHSIVASYQGAGNFVASASPALLQAIDTPADSLKLRAMQTMAAPVVAQNSGQAITGAVDSAIAEGFSEGGGQFITPTASGIRFNFSADPEASAENQAKAIVGDAGPFGRFDTASGFGNAQASAKPGSRIDDGFQALSFAKVGRNNGKPVRYAAPKDWLFWAEVRGSILDKWSNPQLPGAAALYGSQVNLIAGVTRKISPTFLVGALAGWETFDYRSDALQGRLKGDGWTVGAYAGYLLTREIRLDGTVAYSGIGYDGSAGTAQGSFRGDRLLVSGGVTGTYKSFGVVLEPSAKVYALWETENAYRDTLGTFQDERKFSTGRASAGLKTSYPFAWLNSVVSPYVGLYGDYYFNTDSAGLAVPGVIPTGLVMDGWSARATAGVAAQLVGGGQLAVGVERSGLGADFGVWTYRARASIPFSAQ